MEKWLKKWEETGVIQNLPTNKGGSSPNCVGFVM